MNCLAQIYTFILVFGAVTVLRAQPANIPEAARRDFVQGNKLFREAQSSDSYLQAEALYRQAVQIAPGFGDAWFNLSKTQEKLGDYDEAIRSLNNFLRYSPNDPGARAAKDHVYELELSRDEKAKTASAANQAEADRVARLNAERTDQLIVPGERIGPVHLGMTREEVVSVLGLPDITHDLTIAGRYVGVEIGYLKLNSENVVLSVLFSDDPMPKVDGIELKAWARANFQENNVAWANFYPITDHFHVIGGVGLGSSRTDIVSKFGPDQEMRSQDTDYKAQFSSDYRDRGIHFGITSDDRIWRISINKAYRD